jgi:hypothetical protein
MKELIKLPKIENRNSNSNFNLSKDLIKLGLTKKLQKIITNHMELILNETMCKEDHFDQVS